MSFQNYRELRQKAHEHFQKILLKNSSKMNCRRGCTGCCQVSLSISKIEFDFIDQYLKAHPEKLKQQKQFLKSHPPRTSACEFLDSQGDCSIYEVRPLICMTHGVPIKFKAIDSQNIRSETHRDFEVEGAGDSMQRDVCPLNFNGGNIADLPEGELLNIDLLNSILALVNSQYLENNPEGDAGDLSARKPLALDQF